MKHIITLRELLLNQYPKGSREYDKKGKTNTHLTPSNCYK